MKYLGIIAALFALFTLTSCFSQEQSKENTAQQNQIQASKQQENKQNNQQDMQDSIGEDENSTMMQQEEDTMIDESESNQESRQDEGSAVIDAMMEESSTQGEIETTTELSSGEYTPYNDALIGARENTVIFFGADWCPGCVQADKNLMSEDIPENLTILKADFDSDLELRKKYGVVAQHTFVVVDENGEEIKKWVGGYNIQDVLEKL